MLQSHFTRRCAMLCAFLAAVTRVASSDTFDARRDVPDNVVAVAMIDLSKIDLRHLFEQIASHVDVAEEDVANARQMIDPISLQINTFHKLGVERVYVLLCALDIEYGGPTWLIPLSDEADGATIISVLKQMVPEKPPLPSHFAIVNGHIVAASSEKQIAAIEATREKRDGGRAGAIQSVARLEEHGAGVAIVGDDDSRRVVRELFPRMPKPFGDIDGRLIADQIKWAALTFDVTPVLKLELTIDSSDESVGTIVERAVLDALKYGERAIRESARWNSAVVEADLTRDQAARRARAQNGSAGMATAAAAAVGRMQTERDDATVTVTLGGDAQGVAVLGKLLAQPIVAARRRAFREVRKNKFRQIALAFHDYHDREKSFPAAAIYDREGKPLLSWRVALLPYLEQQSLYDQFHLDEPWDSPHNRTLIPRMPATYLDPDPAVQRAIGAMDRTTFVVPVGEKTVFHGREGLKFTDIEDGTSKTVLAVEVVPERAVIWTNARRLESRLGQSDAGGKRRVMVNLSCRFSATGRRIPLQTTSIHKLGPDA